MKKIIFLFSVITFFTLSSCKKEAGQGGNSTIKGNVWVEEWDDATFTIHNAANDRVGMDEDIYIIYGDDATYGDRIKCGPDGVFEFKYLRKGSYTIYIYSDDAGPSGKKAIMKTVEITSKKQEVDAGKFTIKK